MNNEELSCYFCHSARVKVPSLGIAFGMGGDDYSFCEKCLQGMTADEFMKKLFESHGYAYPPRLKNDG